MNVAVRKPIKIMALVTGVILIAAFVATGVIEADRARRENTYQFAYLGDECARGLENYNKMAVTIKTEADQTHTKLQGLISEVEASGSQTNSNGAGTAVQQASDAFQNGQITFEQWQNATSAALAQGSSNETESNRIVNEFKAKTLTTQAEMLNEATKRLSVIGKNKNVLMKCVEDVNNSVYFTPVRIAELQVILDQSKARR